MPRGGHNATPIPLRRLLGNPGKRALPADTPEPAVLTDLKPPPGLDAYGRQAWRRNAPALQALGLLTPLDVDLLAAFCEAYSRWRRAIRALHKLAPGDEAYRPIAVTAERAEQTMRLIAGEFGMTPSGRSRLHVGRAQEDEDPMEMLLNGRQRTG